MRDIPTYIASGVNPRVSIRSAWVEPVSIKTADHPKTKTLAIGDALALEFDDHKLVCTPWPTRGDALTAKEANEYALAPFGIYARWLPKDTAFDDLEISRRIGLQLDKESIPQSSAPAWPIPCNRAWYDMGRVSDHLQLSKPALTTPMRWDFEFKYCGLAITPEFGTGEREKILLVCNTFNLVELMATPDSERTLGGESWSEFSQRYPPRYPADPSHAWGWLLPNAPGAIVVWGFTFTSVMAYALNPIMRRRAASGKSNESSKVVERLAHGLRQRIAQDKQFACAVKSKSVPIEQLSQAAPKEHEGYWRVLLKARQQAP
jgi:hypothetical protein